MTPSCHESYRVDTTLQAAVERARSTAGKGRPVVALLLAGGAHPTARARDGTTLDEFDGNGPVPGLPEGAAPARR